MLGSNRPPVSPATPGTWHTVNDHTIAFQPEGYGYGLGATVTIGLPSGVQPRRRRQSAATRHMDRARPARRCGSSSCWRILGYLPFNFNYAGLGRRADAGGAGGGRDPPAGGQLHLALPEHARPRCAGMWQPGASGVMTQGALMAFENDQG